MHTETQNNLAAAYRLVSRKYLQNSAAGRLLGAPAMAHIRWSISTPERHTKKTQMHNDTQRDTERDTLCVGAAAGRQRAPG